MNRHTRNSRFATLMALSVLTSCSIGAAGTATADNPEGVSAPRAPVKYLTLEKSLIGNDLHEAGVTVEYAGLPSSNLKPLCEEGKRRAQEFIESDKARVRQMIEMNQSESKVGDPSEFMAGFAKEMARQQAEHREQIAQMMAVQQESALQLAQAAANMAQLATALTTSQQLAAVPDEPPAPSATQQTDGDAKELAKRKGSGS